MSLVGLVVTKAAAALPIRLFCLSYCAPIVNSPGSGFEIQLDGGRESFRSTGGESFLFLRFHIRAKTLPIMLIRLKAGNNITRLEIDLSHNPSPGPLHRSVPGNPCLDFTGSDGWCQTKTRHWFVGRALGKHFISAGLRGSDQICCWRSLWRRSTNLRKGSFRAYEAVFALCAIGAALQPNPDRRLLSSC